MLVEVQYKLSQARLAVLVTEPSVAREDGFRRFRAVSSYATKKISYTAVDKRY